MHSAYQTILIISKWLHISWLICLSITTEDPPLDSSCVWQTVAPLPDVTIKLSFNSLEIAPRRDTHALSGGLSALIEVCFLSHTFVKQENSYLQACQQRFPQPSYVVNTVHINSLATSSVHLSVVPSSVHLSDWPASQPASRPIYFVCFWRKWMWAITLLSAETEIAISWPWLPSWFLFPPVLYVLHVHWFILSHCNCVF